MSKDFCAQARNKRQANICIRIETQSKQGEKTVFIHSPLRINNTLDCPVEVSNTPQLRSVSVVILFSALKLPKIRSLEDVARLVLDFFSTLEELSRQEIDKNHRYFDY